jgi:hypothetical protein
VVPEDEWRRAQAEAREWLRREGQEGFLVFMTALATGKARLTQRKGQLFYAAVCQEVISCVPTEILREEVMRSPDGTSAPPVPNYVRTLMLQELAKRERSSLQHLLRDP